MSRRKVIEKRMKQLGITQKQIAQHVMLPLNVIHLWMDCKATLPFKNILTISNILDLDADDILSVK